ncbi:MAG TPA: DUF2806 domain-containing protein [Candidatus Acidoferrales bacterium]|nr:DUF2806 domain-containing protein [Candidatus Acidoferrales bacterium]
MADPLVIKIDLNSETVSKALELIAQAGYLLYEPTRIKRRAKAETDSLIIKTKGEIAIEQLQKQAFYRWAKLETVRQENINKLTTNALQQVQLSKKQIDPSTDADWVRKYFGFSQDISNEDMQLIWSKVLSGELIKSGSFSYKTMSILANMRKDDAELFSKLCSYTLIIAGEKKVSLIFGDGSFAAYNQKAFSFEDLQLLESLGLIHFNDITNFKVMSISSKQMPFICGKDSYLLVTQEEKVDINVGSVMLTREGQELFKVITTETSPNLIEIVKKNWIINGRSLTKIGES